jgi:Tfp pilus assembly protein PilF
MALYATLQQARQLAQFERWDEAVTLLDDVLREAPANVTARNLLALAAVRRDDLDEAERQYEASLAQQPRQHRVIGAMGQIALRRGDLERAEARFREALAIVPEFVEAMSNLGFLAALRGDAAGAEAWYQRALAADPTYPHVHRRLGDLFYDRKDWARARGYYERVLAVLPGHFEALIQAGNCARFLGDVPGAVRFYGDAERRRPDSWIPPYNLACLHALERDPDAALAALGRAADRGLRSPALLDDNDDFATLRGAPGWSPLVARVRAAAGSAPRAAAAASGR